MIYFINRYFKCKIFTIGVLNVQRCKKLIYKKKLSVRIELTISGLLDQRLTTWPQELNKKVIQTNTYILRSLIM